MPKCLQTLSQPIQTSETAHNSGQQVKYPTNDRTSKHQNAHPEKEHQMWSLFGRKKLHQSSKARETPKRWNWPHKNQFLGLVPDGMKNSIAQADIYYLAFRSVNYRSKSVRRLDIEMPFLVSFPFSVKHFLFSLFLRLPIPRPDLRNRQSQDVFLAGEKVPESFLFSRKALS